MLGTNDWFTGQTPIGLQEDFINAKVGTILGNMGRIVQNIRQVAPQAPIFVMNPIERLDFVNIMDSRNYAYGSNRPKNGITLREIAMAEYMFVRGEKIYSINLHDLSGITFENIVHYKRICIAGKEKKLRYPEYLNFPFVPERDPYPYPEDAAYMTYDGLHPSDAGMEAISEVLVQEIKKHWGEIH